MAGVAERYGESKFLEFESEQPSRSNHDVRIAGKIEEELKTETDREKPDIPTAPGNRIFRAVKPSIYPGNHKLRQYQFHEQTSSDPPHAVNQILR